LEYCAGWFSFDRDHQSRKMKPLMRGLWLGVLLVFSVAVVAADFRTFGRDSRAVIEHAHSGQPFVLAFWSVDCAYCGDEIKQLGLLIHQYPSIRLILVNTDNSEMVIAASEVLNRHLVKTPAERWMFDDSGNDRLYFSVDKQWRGELPRTYFYDATGKFKSITGQVDERWLKAWAEINFRHP
jgi:hypothetical protein